MSKCLIILCIFALFIGTFVSWLHTVETVGRQYAFIKFGMQFFIIVLTVFLKCELCLPSFMGVFMTVLTPTFLFRHDLTYIRYHSLSTSFIDNEMQTEWFSESDETSLTRHRVSTRRRLTTTFRVFRQSCERPSTTCWTAAASSKMSQRCPATSRQSQSSTAGALNSSQSWCVLF